jgi:hypothetical protein
MSFFRYLFRVFLAAVCVLLSIMPAHSQPMWRGAFHGMTTDAFLAKYPDAREVVRKPEVVSLRIIDSTIGNTPAAVTFVFRGGLLSHVGYSLKFEGSPTAALAHWDFVLDDFRKWYEPISSQKSTRVVGQIVNDHGRIRMDNDVLGEVAENWETSARTAIELKLLKDGEPGTYLILGSVHLALWEQITRYKVATLASRDARDAKMATTWKYRLINEYVREFGAPTSILKLDKSETLYVWDGASPRCKTTIFVGRVGKILDRKVTGCDE